MAASESLTKIWGVRLLKVGMLVLAFWIVSRNVGWQDALELEDGNVVEGRITSGAEPAASEVVIETAEGTRVLSAGESASDRGADHIVNKKIGMRTAFTMIDPVMYTLSMVLIFGMYSFGVWRWKLLLAAQGIAASYGRAFRLTFIGFFSNNFVPGMTGGDLVKAVIIARDSPGKRSEAVSTVIVDRVVGLAVLAGLSAMAISMNFEKFQQQSYVIFGVFAACIGIFVCLFSRRMRRLLRLDKILRSLPMSEVLMKLDRAFQLYRARPAELGGAFGLSVFAHLCNIGFFCVMGADLELPNPPVSVMTYFATIPIVLIAASVPLFPGGWGVREVVIIQVFLAVGLSKDYNSQVLILSVLHGFSMAAWSLLGGFFLFADKKRGTIGGDESFQESDDTPSGEAASRPE